MTKTSHPHRPSSAEDRIGPEVRRLRELRGLSVRALAERAGYSPSLVSQVENGLASPSIASLERIARALGVGLGDFFNPERVPDILVVRANERPGFSSSWSKAQVSVLTPGAVPDALRAIEVTLQPGGSSGDELSEQGVEQFALVLAGAVTLALDRRTEVLAVGDAVSIPAHTPHQWHNRHDGETRVLLVAAAEQPFPGHAHVTAPYTDA